MSAHWKAIARRTNPKTIPVFPLNGTVLLPGCDLPLNIFEPRYLNMIDDALKGKRLIGMVQSPEIKKAKSLCDIGGLGRITQFSETEDGRYLVVLHGLKRFRVVSEPTMKTPYRQIIPSFDEFQLDPDFHMDENSAQSVIDRNGHENPANERSALTLAMKGFAKSLGVQVDWKALSDIPLPNLVDQATMISPFRPEDKQSLLEASTTDDRRRLLIGLMHLYANDKNGNNAPKQ